MREIVYFVVDMDADVLIESVRNQPKGQRLQTLHKGKVQLFADIAAKEVISVNGSAGRRLTAGLTELDSERPTPNLEEPVVVLGILLKEGERITPASLFVFAKITLLHTDNMLKGQGSPLEVVSISR